MCNVGTIRSTIEHSRDGESALRRSVPMKSLASATAWSTRPPGLLRPAEAHPGRHALVPDLRDRRAVLGGRGDDAFLAPLHRRPPLWCFPAQLRGRLARLFLRGADEQRPCLGRQVLSRAEPFFGDHILFNEFFHGETGAGLGASHQTGWTGLIALLLHPRDPHNPWLLDIASLRTAAQPSPR